MTSDDAMPCALRCRRSVAWMVLALIAAWVTVACGSSASAPSAASPATPTGADSALAANDVTPPAGESAGLVPPTAPSAASPATPAVEVVPTVTVVPTPHPLTAVDTSLPAAPIGLDAIKGPAGEGPLPVSLEIADVGVRDAAIISVGVNPDLSFEVPPADQVGWYRFGPSPGNAGSAVLAAHIAFDGVDGVFRYLDDVELGAIVEVGFDDGSSQLYRVTEVTEYLKQELPESLWARDGEPQLALITCGGTFNPELRSYESNIVAIAVPI